ncbi:hypothetical protein KAU13_01815 [candidate division WOR-3 bacterium]|nr:hypothetical protein [candidate division WOR-3 bacterium]
MKKDAQTFATLTAGPLCDSYENYYESGYFKFREFVLSLLSLEKELTRVAIYTVDGKRVFDSYEFEGKEIEEIEGKEKETLDKRIRQINPTYSYEKD